MINKFIHTTSCDFKPLKKWLVGIICLLGWQGVMANDPAMISKPAIDIEVVAVELLTVSSTPGSNDEALFITFEVGKEYRFYPPVSAAFILYVGQFPGYPGDILPYWLWSEEKQRFQLTEIFYNWKQFEENAPIIFTKLGGGNLIPEMQQAYMTDKTPHFSHSMIVDKRGRIIGGWVCYQKTIYELNYLPGAIVNIHSGNTSISLVVDERGQFSIYDGDGLYLEEGEEYQVEVIVDGVTVLSQTITKENSEYPNWPLAPDPEHFSEITGYVYDIAGEPLAGVTLIAGTHTTTTDENGYYRLRHLVIGATYTLEASKEGYHFNPVEFILGEGQPVTFDLVEKKPTQCLLYAVHDTAKSTAQLLTVDLSANELEITPLDWKLNQAEISLAVGNFDSDGAEEIVTAAQKGGHTIALWELDGQTMGYFDTLLSGILLAAGDLDGDGPSEIIAASRSSDRNTVNVYTANGKMLKTVKLFDNKTRIAPVVGDVDGDGKDDIIAGSLLKANQVAIYYSATQQRQVFSVFQEESRLRKKSTSQGKAKGCDKKSQGNQCDNETTAVSEPAPSQDSGLSQNPEVNQNQQSQEVNQSSGTTESVKTVDTTPSTENQNASKHQNSATVDTTPSTGSQDSSENQNSVIVESVEAIDAIPSTKNQNSPKVEKSTQPTYGVQVATGDFDGDGTNEIVAAQASKGSRVEIYHLDGTFQRAFDAFDSQQGVVITVGNVVGDSSPEIIVGEAKGHLIRVFSGDGEQLFEWEAVKRGEVSSLAVFGCL
jgi:hypothetical protein